MNGLGKMLPTKSIIAAELSLISDDCKDLFERIERLANSIEALGNTPGKKIVLGKLEELDSLSIDTTLIRELAELHKIRKSLVDLADRNY